MRRAVAIAGLPLRHHLALALLLALAVRLLLWSQPLHQLANDEVEYAAVARDLLAGRGWQFYESYRWLRAPLYSLFLAGSLWLAGGDLHCAALPNIALSVATVYLNYRLAFVLFGRRTAFVAAFLTAILWPLATFAILYMSETLFTFLFTAALVCLARWRIAAARLPVGMQQTPPLWPPTLGGVLFGLATLTRSITLLFVPVVVLWLLLEKWAPGDHYQTQPPGADTAQHASAEALPLPGVGAFRRWWAPLCFVLSIALVVAPWTIRNYTAYGRPILVETGLSFNLWFFNEPHEDRDTIYRTLERIRNPAERSDYATAKGMARLSEDPAILLRKLWPNWIYLWRVKPIEDRFIQESYLADVELPIFAAALIFGDALYLVLLLAALVGMVVWRPRRAGTGQPDLQGPLAAPPGVAASRYGGISWNAGLPCPQVLLIAWVIYVVVTVLLTHGEARYQQFLFPALIPYAALALSRVRHPIPGRPAHLAPRSLLPIICLWAVFLWTVLAFYPWDWAQRNIARGWHIMAGDVLWAVAGPAPALDAYRRAVDVESTADAWLHVGHAERAMGDFERARDAYQEAVREAPSYVLPRVYLGDLLRETGDQQQAQRVFAGYFSDPQQMTDWSWRELRPRPVSALDIGNGLDFGYISGMYPAEQQQGATARWTDGHAVLRLSRQWEKAEDAYGPLLVRLRLAAPRPNSTAIWVDICTSGVCQRLTATPTWRIYVVPLPGADVGATGIEIRSPTFQAPDGRKLGILIDRASVIATLRVERFGK